MELYGEGRAPRRSSAHANEYLNAYANKPLSSLVKANLEKTPVIREEFVSVISRFSTLGFNVTKIYEVYHKYFQFVPTQVSATPLAISQRLREHISREEQDHNSMKSQIYDTQDDLSTLTSNFSDFKFMSRVYRIFMAFLFMLMTYTVYGIGEALLSM